MADENPGFHMIHLRPERVDDTAFLFALFCAAREAEFTLLNATQRETLLHFQYQAQSRDYAQRFPRAEGFIIEFHQKPAGRLLLSREAHELRVVDIAVITRAAWARDRLDRPEVTDV
jgi:hypothetical protein